MPIHPSRTPRVLEIISGFAVEGPLGGIERFGIELTRQLVQRQIHPVLCGMWDYATPFDPLWRDRLVAEGIVAFIAAPWDEGAVYTSFVRAIQGMRRAVSDPVDIIHSHCQFGDMAALLLARPLGASALVRTVHNEREWPKRPLRRLLFTNGLFPALFQAELGVSRQVVKNLDSRPVARHLRRQGVYLPNALDFDRFTESRVDKAAKRQELGIPSHGPLVGSIGRLAAQKGYEVLLRAIPEVVHRIPDVHFVIVGSGELAESLRRQAQDMGVADRVTFAGSRSDIEAILGTLDLFVSSSLWEGLPTVILESIAARTPVVATQVSGTTELIRDGESGLLVEPGNPQALAGAVVTILQTPSIAKAYTEHAYIHAIERFSISAVSDAHADLYRRLLA